MGDLWGRDGGPKQFLAAVFGSKPANPYRAAAPRKGKGMESWWGLAALGGLAGVVGSAWAQVKQAASLLAGILVRRLEVDPVAAAAVNAHLHRHYARYGGHRAVAGLYLNRNADGRSVLVAEEVLGAFPAVYRSGCRFLTSSGAGKPWEQDREVHAKGEPPAAPKAGKAVVLVTPRVFGVDLDRLVVDAVRGFAAGGGRRRSFTVELRPDGGTEHSGLPASGLMAWEAGIHTPLSHKAEEFVTPERQADDALVLWEELATLVEEARMWAGNRQWYRDRGLPWRRGWMLHGPPGSGKTRLAMATAADLQVPLVVLRLAGATEQWFREQWAVVSGYAPCVVLLEDLDGVFVGRRNVSVPDYQCEDIPATASRHGSHGFGAVARSYGPPPLTFDALLGAVDGPTTADGVFLVVTTNCPEKIDPAMGGWAAPDGSPGEPPADGESARPGRIDRVVRVGAMPTAAQRVLAERLLGDDPPALAEALAEVAAGSTADYPAVKWREYCVRLALSRMSDRLAAKREQTP